MPTDIDEIFTHGGKRLVDLLFIFLVQEYRVHPTTPKAVALFDIICARKAPARLRVTEILPPVNLQIEAAMRPLTLNLAQVQSAQAGTAVAPPLILPSKFLFDTIELHLRKKSPGIRAVKLGYRPGRSPLQNLPGGRMNAGQTYFVEKVWEPTLRPRLVATGFRRMGSIA